MANEIRAICNEFNVTDSINVILITGNGKYFCCGDEENNYETDPENQLKNELYKIENLRLAKSFLNIEKPIVCAINGDAFGHGLEIAMYSDIRLTVPNAKFGMPCIKYGSIPWDGGTQLLPRIIGISHASDLLMTGKTINAKQAMDIGLVENIIPKSKILNESKIIANSISKLGPIATRYAKEAILKGMDMTMDQGMRLEMDLNLLLQTTKDRAEGLSSFMEKRPPKFIGE
jgi:enoyl-CoA hydratase/carnithine racemase